MRWDEYAEAARGLAEVRAREAERQSRVAGRTASGRAAVDQLRQRLAAQYDYLARLAALLREPGPSLDRVPRAGVSDVDEALRRAWQAVEQADLAASESQSRGSRAVLLPGMPTTGRNVVVYAVATLVAWLASYGLFVLSPQAAAGSVGLLVCSLCGLPVLALSAGYLTIALVGQPRVRMATTASHSIRLGVLICFTGMWLGWLLLLAVATLL